LRGRFVLDTLAACLYIWMTYSYVAPQLHSSCGKPAAIHAGRGHSDFRLAVSAWSEAETPVARGGVRVGGGGGGGRCRVRHAGTQPRRRDYLRSRLWPVPD